MNRRRLIFFLIMLILALERPVRAQAYRNAVRVPPVDVYQSMLNFADRKEYAKVSGSLNVLSPIVNHITAKFKDNPTVMIKTAIVKGDPDEILLGVQTLIILDIKDLLDDALQKIEQTPDASKSAVKAARLNYELLSPYVQKKDFAADQKIKKSFTESFRAMETGSLYSAEKTAVSVEQVKRYCVEIVFNLSRVFPSRAG